MTGTHGSEDGRSALTDIDMIDDDGHGFYQEDCWKFGIITVKGGVERDILSRKKSLSLMTIGRDFPTSPSQLRSWTILRVFVMMN